MPCDGLTGDLKEQGRKFDDTCRVHICICKDSKNRKINDEQGGDKQKKQDLRLISYFQY